MLHRETCQDSLHALLPLEGQVPGAPGSLVHFYTVACYLLQHPDSMNYKSEAFRGLKDSGHTAHAGQATVQDLRRRARYAANGTVRIIRGEGEPPVP